jgi:8-oxo-dGTP diphosphatase
MAIRTIADDTIDPGHEQESAPRFPQLGVLEEARRRPGFPGSELAWAPDRSSRFALTTLWESTGACSAWQTQQLLPVPRSHPDVVGLGQPGTADILAVEPGPASAHATSSSGQVAATPTLTRRTAARRTAINAKLRGSRLLLLVRHAHAGDKHRWQGPDRLRPLSLAGQAEAAGLVIGLDDYPIGRILTSPTLRCQQTVQPLARDRRLRIESEVALGVDTDLARVQALLEDPRLQDTVVCTHGEVIGQVLTRLVADGLAVDQPLQWPKGSTWLLDGTNGRLTHARYLPPLVLAPARNMASAPPGPVLAPDASSRPGV